MAVAENSIVTRTDTQNYFKTNVVDIVLKDAYSSGDVPSISGSGGSYAAIPSGDVGVRGDITGITISSGTINGTTVYNLMIAVIKNCSRVRNFTTNYYWDNSLQKTLSGKAVFKTTLPTIISGYKRDVNGSLLINPSVTNNVTGKIVTTSVLKTLCDNMLKAWQSARDKKITYGIYTCHSSCHSSHSSRSRR